MDFDSLQDDSIPQASAPQKGASSFDSLKDDSETYGSFPQQALAGVEGVAEGIAGPLAPLAEKHLMGFDPEEIRLRAENNPTTHTLGELGGFGLGAISGTGEAALLGHAGEAVAKGVSQAITGGVAKSALQYTGARIASGAARVGAEMALMQAGDEGTKAILDDPHQTIGSAAANIGLASLIGAGTGGVLTGSGLALKAGLDAAGIDEFKNRLGLRASGVNPAEAIQKEVSDAYDAYHEMGSEVSGPTGLKAQALEKIMPEMSEKIASQVQSISDAGSKAFKEMAEKGVPDRLIKDYTNEFTKFQEVVTNPSASVGEHFDALNSFKNNLQDYSKGRWGLNSVQRTADDYQFINITKSLANTAKMALEDSETWGREVADLQKNLNSAWHAAIPAVKDMEKKFMSKVGNEIVIDPAKFNTYLNQNGKATSQTIKQQMMGKFVDAIEKFKSATDDAYEKAGVPNPRAETSLAMGELKHSLEKTSLGHKLADVVYDKLGAQGLGHGAGAAVGGGLGSATGLPGGTLTGAYLGKEILGPAFSAIFKPLTEMASNSAALKKALSFGKAILSGDAQLEKSAKNIFISGGKVIPGNFVPSEKDISKLSAKVDDYSRNPQNMVGATDDLSHYMPAHGMAVSTTTARAVQYLAAQKPSNPKMSPLDADIPLSKAQEATYDRILTVAQQPLMVLQHISDGTLLPQDINTLKAIYPEFYTKMASELTHSMIEQQQSGHAIPYSLRQSISQFVGKPLDSTMLPMSIQSIQSVFAQNSAQQQPQQKAPSAAKTNKLGTIAKNSLTSDQAREQRSMKV